MISSDDLTDHDLTATRTTSLKVVIDKCMLSGQQRSCAQKHCMHKRIAVHKCIAASCLRYPAAGGHRWISQHMYRTRVSCPAFEACAGGNKCQSVEVSAPEYLLYGGFGVQGLHIQQVQLKFRTLLGSTVSMARALLNRDLEGGVDVD